MDSADALTGLLPDASDESPSSISPSTASTHNPKLKSRACDTCHKRKVKCDNAKPSCSECVKFHAQCTYVVAGTPKKITRRRPKRNEALEKRVNELENLLRQAVNGLEATAFNHNHTNESTSLQEISTVHSPKDSSSPPNSTSTTTTSEFEAQYVETPLFNRELVVWISGCFATVSVSRPPYSRTGHTKLRRRSEFVALIRSYFSTYNRIVPLFDEDDFMNRFTELDMDQIRADAAFWTATNVMCAIALRQQNLTYFADSPNNPDREAWEYLDTALDKAVELTVRGSNDLLAIQALVGMTIFLQTAPDAHAASTLLAAANRLLLQNGLHIQQDEQFSGQYRSETFRLMIQRNRVFWIAFNLDHDLATRLERPPLIHEDDIGTDLPLLYPEDGLGCISSVDNSTKINFLRARSHLALIENRIHRRLMSARAKRQTALERQAAINELEAELESWKASYPDLSATLDYLATNRALWADFEGAAFQMLRALSLAYLGCHANLHGLSYRSLRVQEWSHPRLLNTVDPTEIDLLPSISDVYGDSGPPNCCVSVARASLILLHLSQNTDHACTWSSLHHLVTALIVLVSNAARNPLTEESMADIQLVLPVVEMLRRFEEVSMDSGVENSKKVAAQLVHEYARRALFDQAGFVGMQSEPCKIPNNVTQ
ncbi:fungal-specific transcription factor domain-containing protein [Trichoderma afarasin]